MPLSRRAKLLVGTALALLAVAMFAGLYLVSAGKRAHRQVAGPDVTTVVVTASSCEPQELTVPAGRAAFQIVNRSPRVVEWEILDGALVVDERENIAPGFSQQLVSRLDPGVYDITCGLLSNPRGKLHVLAVEGTTSAPPTKPALVDLIGPLAEYEVFLIGEMDELKAKAGSLAAAVTAGDLAGAKALYAPTHAHYLRLKPVAGQLSTLDAALDSRAEDHAGKEGDPGFTGFHRLEHGLFAQGSTEGLAPVAGKLVADLDALDTQMQALTPAADRLVSGAAVQLRKLAATTLAGQESSAGPADLSDLQAGLDGAEKIADLFGPLTKKADKALADRIEANIAGARSTLSAFQTADGSRGLSQADRDALRTPVTALADELTSLREVLGLA